MPYSIRKNTLRSPAGRRAALVALAVLLIAGAAPAAADLDYDGGYGDTAGYDTSYSYVRTLEGSATLVQGDTQDRDALQVNQPILVGDRIWIAPNGRAEVVLSDRNLLRIDGGSEILFEALASSPDRDDPSTVLRLSEGNVQLVVEGDFVGDDYPRIDTPNATVYANQTGTYRITADEGWSEVVARDGAAEVVTREGSVILRQGEEAVVEGSDRPRTRVRRASREDSLEIWGERLDREGRNASGYVDDSIAYEAAHLDRYGSWSRIDGRYAWRPRVSVEWRPYWNGRWRFSSLGLTWVSYEPWGWVPYHYGTWDYLPGHGWAWFPGHRFAPAWVYWNWTDHYAGWVPVGYYSRHYWSSYGRYGLRAGVYGYAGGHWDHYRYWNFCDLRYFGHRYQYRHHGHGDRFGRENRYAVPKRGILTTDTRGITRTAVQRGEGIERILVDRGTRAGRDLADVTPFVERRRELPDDVRGRVLVDRGDGARDSGVRQPTRLLATDGVPGAGDRPTRAAAAGDRDPRRAVERAAPGTAGIERAERATPARRARPEAAADRSPDRSEAPRVTPSRDWRERDARPRREAPARIERTERGDASPARTERVSPNEVRRRPGVRESESDRSSITRRVVEGVRSNERSNDRRAAPSRTERQSPPSRTERQSPPPARERSGSASDSSSSSRRESARPSRRESPPPRSSRSVEPTRSRTASPPSRAESSRPSSRPSPSRARSAPSRPSRPPASTRSSSRPSRSSSKARSSRPSRPPSRATSSRSSRSSSKARSSRPSRAPSRATSSRSSRSSSKARSSRPSRSPSRAKSSRPSRSSSRASQPSRSRAPSRSKARKGKPPTL